MSQVYNPFLPLTEYIPDGEPHVFGDRIYIFGSHDLAGGDSFCLLDYVVWSAPLTDLSCWSNSGVSYRADQDPLYSDTRPYMFAPDVVQGNDGKYYLYYCLAGWKGQYGYDGPISVAVSDKPDGLYEYLGYVRNPDNTPFQKFVLFDPAVINDSGVIRLYYGAAPPAGLHLTKYNQFIVAPVLEKIFNLQRATLFEEPSPFGANMVVLQDDMLTVSTGPVRILPTNTRGTDFQGHSFFEGSSIRKIGDMYYFVYSSQLNHELCYATSRFPDRDFKFGGTLISTGDVGLGGRPSKKRLNATGTTHGSIEYVNGQWYVFYHRLTHKSDYSRQACAEPIIIGNDGKINQVEVTSCGLNGKPLTSDNAYPASIACNLTNGRMPHISNKRIAKRIPFVTEVNGESHITDIRNRTLLGYKYFDFPNNQIRIDLRMRGVGAGVVEVYCDDNLVERLGHQNLKTMEGWQTISLKLRVEAGTYPLYLFFKGKGEWDLLEIALRSEGEAYC